MQRDRHLASGDLCRESTPLGERFGFHWFAHQPE
jgi:hypothetical protein